jgi:hypothetical protein
VKGSNAIALIGNGNSSANVLQTRRLKLCEAIVAGSAANLAFAERNTARSNRVAKSSPNGIIAVAPSLG